MPEKTYCRVPAYTRLTRFQLSLLETRALRAQCAPIFLPLFDHLVSMARDSYRAYEASGRDIYARRAGQELSRARRVAAYQACKACGQPIVDGTDRCSADLSHDARGAFPALQSAIAEPCWGETIGARCC